MRADVARVLLHLGYKVDVDFVATGAPDGSVAVDWLSASPMPSEADIDAAAPAALAAEQASIAENAQGTIDKADLKSQADAAVTRLTQIVDATPPFTSAQRDAAIQDMARYQRAIIRVLRRLI